jgi:hypothetical protein
MDGLKHALQAWPSGPRLAAALEGASLGGSEIPALMSALIQEVLAAGAPSATPVPAPAAPAAAPEAPLQAPASAPVQALVEEPVRTRRRAVLPRALCVIDDLKFLEVRHGG